VAQVDNERIATGSLDQKIKVWNIESGECLHTIVVNGVYALLRLKSMEAILYGTSSGHIEVRSIRSKTNTNQIAMDSDGEESDDFKLTMTLTGHLAYVTTICELRDGTVVSGAGDKTLRIWNVSQGVSLKVFMGPTGGMFALQQLPSDMIIPSCTTDSRSNSGNYLAVASLSNIYLYDLSDGTCFQSFGTHKHVVVNTMVVSNNLLLSASKNGILKLWDLQKKDIHCLGTYFVNFNVHTVVKLEGDTLILGGTDAYPSVNTGRIAIHSFNHTYVEQL